MSTGINYFNQRALDYDLDLQRVKRAEMFAAEIRSAITLTPEFVGLDYGCGTGLVSFLLQPHLKKIILADNSPGMLAELQKKIEVNKITNLFPQALDLAQEDTLNERFNIIYSLMTLHHILDTKNILAAFYSLLNAPGFLCIGDVNHEDGSFHGQGFNGHNGFAWNELTNVAKQVGFKNIRFKNFFSWEKVMDTAEKRQYPLFFMVAEKY